MADQLVSMMGIGGTEADTSWPEWHKDEPLQFVAFSRSMTRDAHFR